MVSSWVGVANTIPYAHGTITHYLPIIDYIEVAWDHEPGRGDVLTCDGFKKYCRKERPGEKAPYWMKLRTLSSAASWQRTLDNGEIPSMLELLSVAGLEP